MKLWALGRADDALVFASRARQLDPVTPAFALQVADLLVYGGRLEEARATYAQVLNAEPENGNALVGLAQLEGVAGRFDAAIDAMRHAYASEELPAPLAALVASARGEAGYRAIGRVAAALEIDRLQARKARGGYVSPLDLARGYAQLGDRDRAFAFLDAAFEDLAPGLVFLQVDRAWTSVKDDSRFAAAVSAVGLA
jgi:tetratricopeptide (TPR) repeat protein